MKPSTIVWEVTNACLRKANLTEEQANSIIDHRLKEGMLLYYYKCKFCSSFHLTRKSPLEHEEKLEIA